jgi:tripartite-type tricarboxylate transporter receptor subunit TctC
VGPKSICRMFAARAARACRRSARIAGVSILVLAAWSLVGWMRPATADDRYPSRPITLIVPYPPGGVVDMTARLLADGLKDKFHQSVVVLNKPGANGMIGLAELVKSAPDGYTLLLNNDGGLGIPPAVDPNFKFDPEKDYMPVAQAVEYGDVLIVNSSLPVKTVQEFIAYAKAHPNQLNFGTPGVGTLPHIASELFMHRTGVQMVHVPYKGAAPALADLLAGTVTMNVQSIPTALGQIHNERMRVLAVLGDHRLEQLPDVPTMQESGVPGFVLKSWLGVFAPAGLPASIRDTLSESVVEIVKQPKIQEKFRVIGFEPIGADAATFSKVYYSDIKRWKTFAAENGIKLSQ